MTLKNKLRDETRFSFNLFHAHTFFVEKFREFGC